MKITHIKKLVFSPTGGTQKVIDIVSRVWKLPQETIDLSDYNLDFSQYCFTDHDLCLIAVPAFGGRVPAIAVKRLQQMRALQSPTLLIVAYGNRAYDDTLLELKEVVKKQGFACTSAIAAISEHSIVPQFGMGRPDRLDDLQLTEFALNIKDILVRVTDRVEVNVPGHFPYREYNGIPIKPKTSKKCSQCGLCAKKCPVHAIPLQQPKATDDKKCISCMRCVAICPQRARRCHPLMIGVLTKKLAKLCAGSKANELFLFHKANSSEM